MIIPQYLKKEKEGRKKERKGKKRKKQVKEERLNKCEMKATQVVDKTEAHRKSFVELNKTSPTDTSNDNPTVS